MLTAASCQRLDLQVQTVRLHSIANTSLPHCCILPVGYWENDDNLDRELGFFVAAFWVELPHPDTGRPYYYNQVSGRLAWSKPQQLDELSQSAGIGAGAAAAADVVMPAEAPEDRVMPSSKMLIAGDCAGQVRGCVRIACHQWLLPQDLECSPLGPEIFIVICAAVADKAAA